MRRLLSIFVISAVLLLVSYPQQLGAHGLAITQQQIVNDYIIEFEYDSTGQVLAGELTSYAFELLKKTNNEQAPYERLFVKISKQGVNHPTFVANLVPVELLGRKTSRANITLSDTGPYTAELSFYAADTELAKAAFNLDVTQNPVMAVPEESSTRRYAYIGIFVVLLTIITVQSIWLLKRKKHIASS